MAAISVDPRFNHLRTVANNNHQQHGVSSAAVEEIEGLIRVSKDGHVERPAIIPNVPCTSSLDQNLVTSKDVFIDKLANLWARIYVPNSNCPNQSVPLLVYFHGGGFCVGSAAWSCYHQFLANLAAKAGCVVVSVNYRLAPENRLPMAYEDGFAAVMWIKQQALSMSSDNKFWLSQCNVSSLFLAGDSAGANIAYHVATRLGANDAVSRPLRLKGLVLIQPFFGGEARTASEKYASQPPNSVLTLSASDTYWRLSLPSGSSRDHPWCNPLAGGGSARLRETRVPPSMVCVSETDILRDRNLEFSNALVGAGKKVETKMYRGVGHAFQVLHNSQASQARTQEMVSHIRSFINQ